jgi:hypothetical protein
VANQRLDMYGYRQVLIRTRLGDTDRAVTRAGLMGRRKVATLRPAGRASRLARSGGDVAGRRGAGPRAEPGTAAEVVVGVAGGAAP